MTDTPATVAFDASPPPGRAGGTLRRDIASAYLVTAARIGAWAVVSALVYRRLGADAFAMLALIRSTVGLLAYTSLGLAPAMVRALAEAQSGKDDQEPAVGRRPSHTPSPGTPGEGGGEGPDRFAQALTLTLSRSTGRGDQRLTRRSYSFQSSTGGGRKLQNSPRAMIPRFCRPLPPSVLRGRAGKGFAPKTRLAGRFFRTRRPPAPDSGQNVGAGLRQRRDACHRICRSRRGFFAPCMP